MCIPSIHEVKPLSSLEPTLSSATNTCTGTDTVFKIPAAGKKLIQRRHKSRRGTIQPCLTLPPPPPPPSPPDSPKSAPLLSPVQPISTLEGDHVRVSSKKWSKGSSPAVSEGGGQKTGDILRRTGSRESTSESHLSSFSPLVTKTRHYAHLSSSAQLKRLQSTSHRGATSRELHTHHRSTVHQLKMTEFVRRNIANPKQVLPATNNKGIVV